MYNRFFSYTIFFCLLVCATSLSGCGTYKTRTMVEEKLTHDSIFVYKEKVDTLLERDSVILQTKGDTVFVCEIKYRYKSRIVRDTIHTAKADTAYIPVEVPVEKEVERSLTLYQKFMMEAGRVGCSIVLFGLLTALTIFILKKKYGKK